MVTIAVRSLDKAKEFYENILGFTPGVYYEPTRWQSYSFEGNAVLGILENTELERFDTGDIINFDVENIDEYWQEIKDRVDVESELGKTPYGSNKFVIRDPDGFRLGFVGRVE